METTNMGGYVNYTALIRPVCLSCMDNNCLGSYLQQQGILTGNETAIDRCRIECELRLTVCVAPNRTKRGRDLFLRYCSWTMKAFLRSGTFYDN